MLLTRACLAAALVLKCSCLPHGTLKRRENSSTGYITLEEHWVSPALAGIVAALPLPTLLGVTHLTPLLVDVGPTRLASMNANNIGVQIISHVPAPAGLFQPNSTQLANDQLAAKVAANPSRFRGFAILPMGIPTAAAAELRRSVEELGFVGALVDAQLSNGQFYDNPAYDVLWAVASELDVPIYLHPSWPNATDITSLGLGLYAPSVPGEYSEYEATTLGTTSWGWHGKTGISFLKLYLAGVFERFPKLQIVLGHMGELIPFFLDRQDRWLSKNRTLTFREAWNQNVYVTTSGMFSLDPFTTVLRTTDISRILYSVDYPFEVNEDGTMFLNSLQNSGLVSSEEFDAIAFGNSKRLFRI